MRIAVVGTGISGLASAWLLSRRHEVHVFEQRRRLGGHTHTVAVRGAGRRGAGVDTGFIVYNEVTYPLLTRLFDELAVATQPSDMSWSLRCERCDLEYAGNARGIAAQPRNLLDPRYLGFLADILRFNTHGRRLADDPRTRDVTLGRFLRAAGLDGDVARHYVLPMAAAIWSGGTGTVQDLPLGTLLTFFRNHGLLGVGSHHPWRTVTGGSSRYIPRLTAPLKGRLHTGDGVIAITRDVDGVELRTVAGRRGRFDAVVLATHADQALALLTDPRPAEKELLGPWEYADNDTWLHTDPQLLPRRAAARASWNYLLEDCRQPGERVSLSYHMNRLQSLEGPEDHVVTLNPATPPRADRVVRRMTYRHPVFSPASVATQPHLDTLNGPSDTYYAGAYQRYGFHEDGLWSAVRVARHLGVEWPA